MARAGKIDGWLLGGLLGVIIVFPGIGTTIFDWISSIIPAGWDWFGSYTEKILIIAAFSLVGAITDWTK